MIKLRNINLQPLFTTLQMPMQLATAGLLVIQNRKLLLAYSINKACFYLPGGKIDAGETAEEGLCREIAEELNVQLSVNDITYYCHITAPAYGEPSGIIMEQDCFFISKSISPSATAEIGELKYFSFEEYLHQNNTAPGAVMIMEKLKKDNLID
jgi:8-oxo-dGTP pyrophosphatase MutT (NUDIX family)